MAALDDYLARIGGMGVTPTNASPYTSPQSFGSAFGTTPVNIGGMSGLPGGTAPIARTTGISPMRGIGFGSMPPSVSPTPTRGFGSRLGDAFKDPSKFADLATGAALISGTPIAEAFAIREALAPTTKTSSTSFGKLYDVIDKRTGQKIKQVSDKDTEEIQKIYNDPNLDLRELQPDVETGDVPKGYRMVTGEDGQQRLEYIKGYEDDVVIDRLRQKGNIISTTIRQTGLMEDALLFLIDYASQRDSDTVGIILSGASEDSLKQKIKDYIISDVDSEARSFYGFIDSNRFVNAITEMRNNSPTGGAVGQVTEKEMGVLRDSRQGLNPFAGQGFVRQLTTMLSNTGKARQNVISQSASDIRLDLNKLLPETRAEVEPRFIEMGIDTKGVQQ